MATRHERVVLDLEDRLSGGMARAAAATALLDKQLNSLSGRSVQSHRAMQTTERDVASVGRTSESSGRQIDKLSGRLQILAEVAGAIGPAFVPIGAAAVPVVAGLANQLGIAALAGGTAVLAFQGVGTALKALDQYQLEPTAAHLQALQVAMSAVGPAGRDFVRQLAAMQPLLMGIQNTARQGLFPGVTDALEGISTRAPQVNRLIETISTTLGGLFSEAGQGIEGGALDSFIRTLDTEARPALTDLGHSIADVTLGLASLFQAFVPLSLDFGAGLARAAAGFREWADGLSATQGFQDFVAYIQSNGPKVLDLLGALGNDFVQIAEAAAPLGGPVLESLTALARVISSIADSPLGTPIFTAISALSAYKLALQATEGITERIGERGGLFGAITGGKASASRSSLAVLASGLTNVTTASERATTAAGALNRRQQELRQGFKGVAAGGAQLAGVALLATGTADKLGLTNTATLSLAGSMAGPLGAAAGGAVGAFLDLSAATSGIHNALDESGGSVDALAKKLHDLQSQASQLTAQESSGGIGGFLGGVKDVVGGNLASSLSFLPVVGSYIAQFGGAKTATQELNGEIGKTQAQLGSTAGPLHEYANSIRNSGVAAGHTAAEINGMVSAMQANRTAALGAFDAETQYRQALKDARAQAAKNNAGLRGSSDAALANRGALSQLAAAWNNQSDAVRNNVGRFRQARSAFIQTATAMRVPIDQARALASRLLAIPKSVVTRASIVGGTEALREIDAIIARTRSIPRSISTTYYVNQINSISKRYVPGKVPGSADGSMVPKDGGPYADRYLYMLAPGEEIITNRHGEADRFRAMRDAGQIPGLASGGTAKGLTRSEFSAAAHSFDLYGGQTAKQISNEFYAFAHSIRTHGGHLSKAFDGLEKRAKHLEVRFDAASAAVDREKKHRDDLISARDSLVSSVSSNLTSNPFDKIGSASVWMSPADRAALGSGSILGTLRTDIANAGQYRDLVRSLTKRHVSGLALGAAEEQGLPALQALAGLSGSDLRSYQALFNQRAALVSQVSAQAGGAAYNALIATSNHHLSQLVAQNRELNRRIQHLEHVVEATAGKTGHAVGKEINKAAAHGARHAKGHHG